MRKKVTIRAHPHILLVGTSLYRKAKASRKRVNAGKTKEISLLKNLHPLTVRRK